jgi:hypothetical protein
VKEGGATTRVVASSLGSIRFPGAKPTLAGILSLELFERFAIQLDYGIRRSHSSPCPGTNTTAAEPLFGSAISTEYAQRWNWITIAG